MANIPELGGPSNTANIRPIQVICYPDQLRVWTHHPFSRRELKILRQWSEWVRPINCFYDDRIVRQVLAITRPAWPALVLLSKRHDVHLSYLEVALDWDFATRLECAAARALLDQHHVKTYQRSPLQWYEGTRYTNRRGAGNNLAIYSSKLSRISKSFCVHLDWRITGAGALRAAGLATIADLMKLDPVEFWHKRLRLYEVDLRELGRLYSVKVMKRRRRGYCVQRFPGLPFTYDWDQSVGHVLYYSLRPRNRSAQVMVTRYRKQLNVKRCLAELEVGHLRPKSRSQYYNYAPMSSSSKNPPIITNTSLIFTPKIHHPNTPNQIDRR